MYIYIKSLLTNNNFLILQNNLDLYYKHSQKTKQSGINLSKI